MRGHVCDRVVAKSPLSVLVRATLERGWGADRLDRWSRRTAQKPYTRWQELNVSTWIARVQPREYVLRATGWVRTVSGIQSLLSVYLLALWVLTYFGRPFE